MAKIAHALDSRVAVGTLPDSCDLLECTKRIYQFLVSGRTRQHPRRRFASIAVFTELGGQFLYNNPFVFVFVWLAVMAVMRNKQRMRHEPNRLLLWLGMPLIVLFLFFSLFRPTLPHWTGPAYNTLLLLAAARLSSAKRLLFPWQAVAALSLLLVIITLGSLQVKYGLIPVRDQQPYHLLGKNDVTLDMYGWRALKPALKPSGTKNRRGLDGSRRCTRGGKLVSIG